MQDLFKGMNRMAPIARRLNQELGIGAKRALYSRDGNWYENLERFPGVLFDLHGYVLFDDEGAYRSCRQLRPGKKLNVTGNISGIAGYVRDSRIAKFVD